MEIIKTKFKDLFIVKKKSFKDVRGYFLELYKKKIIKKEIPFYCISYSKKNVFRGLHLQTQNRQAKYISVLRGKIIDIALDLRKNSKTFGKHFKIILSQKNSKSIYIPPGFIHGFLGKDKENIVVYSCTNYRDKDSEIGVLWNDKDLNIDWKIKKPILSQKDAKNIPFNKLNN